MKKNRTDCEIYFNLRLYTNIIKLSPFGFLEEEKEIIQAYKKEEKMTREIYVLLFQQEIDYPTPYKISNFLQNKKKLAREQIVSLKTIKSDCLKFIYIPEELDKANIFNYKINYIEPFIPLDKHQIGYRDTEHAFYLFISIRHYLSDINKRLIIHADATYKLIWEGFSVLFISFTNFYKHFHPLGIQIFSHKKEYNFKFMFDIFKTYLEAISSNLLLTTSSLKKVPCLFSDSTQAIYNAFNITFGVKSKKIHC